MRNTAPNQRPITTTNEEIPVTGITPLSVEIHYRVADRHLECPFVDVAPRVDVRVVVLDAAGVYFSFDGEEVFTASADWGG
jgi:hypothetical protein